MKFWIQTCACGASAPDLSALPVEAKAILTTSAYAVLRGAEATNPFLRWATIAEGIGKRADAAEAVLQAAWVLDDAGPAEADAAAALRLQAVALWGAPDGRPLAALRQADLLRRAGSFAQAAAMLDGIDFAAADEAAAALITFQRERLAAQDRARHSLSSVLRPPVRRPHASHGAVAQAKPGFWARLRGQ